MAETPHIHENQIGAKIVVQVNDSDGNPKNISTAEIKKIYFKKPDRTFLIKDAQFNTDGLDGLLKYETVDGDMVPGGNWQAMPYVKMPGFDGFGAVVIFDVYAQLVEGKPYPNG